MSTETTTQTGRTGSRAGVKAGFTALMLVTFLATLDSSVVATALPRIARDLDGLGVVTWVSTAYLLAFTGVMPLCGKLIDLFGRKQVFLVAQVVFLASSVLCGLSASMGMLITFRAVQGVGAAGLMVGSQVLVADVVSDARARGRYLGLLGAAYAVSSVAGPVIGGFFTDHLTWRWVFFVNVPLGLLSLALTVTGIRVAHTAVRKPIDLLGGALLAGTVVCVVLLTNWGGTSFDWVSPTVIGLAVGAVVLALLWVVAERRATEPIIPLRLFGNNVFVLASAISLLTGVALYAAIIYLPLFLQVAGGLTATNSGLVLMPLMVGSVAGSLGAGQVVARTGRYKIFPVIGTVVTAAGMLLLSTLTPDTSRLLAAAYMLVVGLGIGMVAQLLVAAVQHEMPPAELGVGTSTVNFARQAGSSFGVALGGNLIAHQSAAAGVPRLFLVVAPLMLVGFVLATRLRQKPVPAAA